MLRVAQEHQHLHRRSQFLLAWCVARVLGQTAGAIVMILLFDLISSDVARQIALAAEYTPAVSRGVGSAAFPIVTKA
jgi:hypothetical protein